MQQTRKQEYHKYITGLGALFIALILFCAAASSLYAQYPVAASPARWIYPLGNSEATRLQSIPSAPQRFDTLILKWASKSIAGDVEPLIGNIIDNPKLTPVNPFAPLEIVAVIGGQLVLIDATGRSRTPVNLPPFVRGVSVLLDSSMLPLKLYEDFPSLIALESIENNKEKDNVDSLAYSYLFGFDKRADSIAFIKRLVLDVRDYNPNLFAGIKPVFGHAMGNDLQVHAIVNMSTPTIPDPPLPTPFFRGLTQFNATSFSRPFPSIDAGDTLPARFTVGPDVSFCQPSISDLGSGRRGILLPSYPQNVDYSIPNPLRSSLPTFINRPYLMGLELQNLLPSEGIAPIDLSSLTQTTEPSSRPRIKPYYVKVNDAGAGNAPRILVLLAEEYLGRDSSVGRSRLHLYQTNGDAITLPGDATNPSFNGAYNHAWSIAVGDVDGLDTNAFLPYYPHSPGSEIIATQSTREFAYPGSKLMIFRYRSGKPVQKPAPRNSFLNPFDTIVSVQMTGWVAAVADIDNNGDGKAEIIMADGNDMYILHLRDYMDSRFRSAAPFDTAFRYSFPAENINHVAVADVDGDSYMDILVTTNVRTYLFGMLSPNSLLVTSPSRLTTSGVTTFCRGDSALVEWYNVFRGQPAVRVRFQEYRNGIAYDSARTLAKSVDNSTDTVRYYFLPDSSLAGKTGRFLIESTTTSYIKDSSGFVQFFAPLIRFDSTTKKSTYYALQQGTVTGIAYCIDSLRLMGSLDRGKTWTLLDTASFSTADSVFTLKPTFPCPTFFGCEKDADSLIYLRVEGFNSGLKSIVRSDTAKPHIKPFPIRIAIYPEPSVLCSQRDFIWLFPSDSTVCDSVSISVSRDGGKTFDFMEKLPRAKNQYVYRPNVVTPDTVILRVCCNNNTCLRVDTAIINARSTFIHAVAPNPFEPGVEMCEIFSASPVSTTATVRIYDQNNRVLNELVSNQPRMANLVYCDKWDGKTDDGKTVAMGMYYVVVEFGDGSREFYPIFVKKR